MKLSNFINKPVITEKSFDMAGKQFFSFKVSMLANKASIKNEIEKLYGVNVEKINILVIPGKKKRIIGTRKFKTQPKFKKAVVKLKEGQTIDIFTKE